MEDEKFDAVVVGAGPAGCAAAMTMAKAGLSVAVLERGAFPGVKNVMGGILYSQPTAELVGDFWADAPLERHIIEQRYMFLTEDTHVGLTYRTQEFGKPPYNSFTVMRADWDQWFAAQAEAAGAFIIPEMPVTDLLWDDGRVVGVTTGTAEGELYASVVVLCDGANSLLAQRAGMHREWRPDEQALVAKELIQLDASTLEDRFNLQPGQGTAMEIFGESTSYLLGYGFIYTNNDSLSIGTGALLSDLKETGLNVNDILERFKQHTSVAPLLEGGETIEYSAHLIPEGGYNSLPDLYIDGALVAGDAAMMVNAINREGSNYAMISGKLAAETVVRAVERNDYSAATLSYYRELLDDSFIMKDLYKIRNISDFAHRRPYLLDDVPAALAESFREYLTVDGVPKKRKQSRIIKRMLSVVPPGQLIRDALDLRKVAT